MTTSFKFEHQFDDIPIKKFIAHLNHPALNKMLQEELDFDVRELINKTEKDNEITWQFMVKKTGDLPKAIKKIIDGNGISWIETSKLVVDEQCIYWNITPQSKLIKFTGSGRWKLDANNGGCIRTIDGTVSVDIPFVGKVLESFLIKELKKTYEIEPKIQSKFYSTVD